MQCKNPCRLHFVTLPFKCLLLPEKSCLKTYTWNYLMCAQLWINDSVSQLTFEEILMLVLTIPWVSVFHKSISHILSIFGLLVLGQLSTRPSSHFSLQLYRWHENRLDKLSTCNFRWGSYCPGPFSSCCILDQTAFFTVILYD